MAESAPIADERLPTYGIGHCFGRLPHVRCLLRQPAATGVFAYLQGGIVLGPGAFGETGEGPGWTWEGCFTHGGLDWEASHIFLPFVDPPSGLVNYVFALDQVGGGAAAFGLRTDTISLPGNTQTIPTLFASAGGTIPGGVIRTWISHWVDCAIHLPLALVTAD